MVCRDLMQQHGDIGPDSHVFVLGGDGPLIRGSTLKALTEKHLATGAAVTLATSVLENPTGYGRIVRDAAGQVTGIVEHGDATPEQRALKEVNPTYWMFRTHDLFESLQDVRPNNKKGEYYLTDTLSILKSHAKRLEAVPSVPPEDVLIDQHPCGAGGRDACDAKANSTFPHGTGCHADFSGEYVD